MPIHITVRPDQEHQRHLELMQSLDLPLATDQVGPKEIQLGWQQDKLALFPADAGPVFVDFAGGKSDHRRRFGGGVNQPLPRAIGPIKSRSIHVIDATAGLARDSFVLASLGFQVTMIEQSPLLVALISDGLVRAKANSKLEEIVDRLSLLHRNSIAYLKSGKRADVIYLDPMYPHKKKSAAVKKEMRVIQHVIGGDESGAQLLSIALEQADYRVVVKRPKSAESLAGVKPNTSIVSPNTRYDIYTIRSFKKTDN